MPIGYLAKIPDHKNTSNINEIVSKTILE